MATDMKLCAITPFCDRKRAALLFDKIIVLCAAEQLNSAIGPVGIWEASFSIDMENFGEFLAVCDAVWATKNITLVPVYGSRVQMSCHYPSGSQLAYEAALHNLPSVIEHELEWEQVWEFRKDMDASWKYRALRHWLSSGLAANSVSEAADLIGRKIADYEWAIKKHGLKTATSTLSIFLKGTSLAKLAAAAGVGSVVGGPIWGAFVGAGMLVSEISIHLAERMIDLRDTKMGKDSEIAILYDIRKELGNS
jgi:hypothetical protein